MTTNGRVGKRKGTKSQDPVDYIINLGKDVLDGYEAAVEQAIEKSMAIREAEAKFGNPGAAGIEVRQRSIFQGLLRRENPEDRKRYEAQKANRDRAKLTADHIKLLGGYATKGQEFVTDVIEHLTEDTHTRSAEIQPIAEMLTQASTKILIASYVESLKFLAERGFQEVDQATPPGQHRQ
jgi:hypothetical protein